MPLYNINNIMPLIVKMIFVNFIKSKQIYNGTSNNSSIHKDEQGCK